MAERRKICVVTGTRAEYGLLSPLMRKISDAPGLELQVAVTGTHLSPVFGHTIDQILRDGFAVQAKVEMLLSSDSAVAAAKSLGLGIIGFADAFADLEPDIVVVLGDRFEIMAASQAALLERIPIAHIHGGETTEGAFDEGIRHALTKMAQWHFVATEPYRKRVVQMGEAPDRVFNVGALGVDQLATMKWMTRSGLEQALGMTLRTPLYLVTYHPATRGTTPPAAAVDRLLAALDRFPDAVIVFTYPNADPGGMAIISRIDNWVTKNAQRAKAFVSLGQERYLSLLREADLVIGNSSSALIEAPALGTITINIGDRQKGRLRAMSVIDVPEDSESIESAIRKAQSTEMKAVAAARNSPYGNGNVADAIVGALSSVALNEIKSFFDIEHGW